MTLATILSYLPSILFVLIFFGFCIFIHEFGHLLAAIWRGLHVEKFSIGFGKPIKSWKIGGIDYLLSWIPFGGYVAIPQLEPTDQIVTESGLKLPQAKPLDRIIVAFAGPLFNILFGFALGAVIWIFGYHGPRPAKTVEIGSVPAVYVTDSGETRPTPEAAAGLRAGDVIVKVNGHGFTRGWDQVVKEILFSDEGRVTLDITRQGQPMTISYTLVANPDYDGIGFPFIEPRQTTQITAIFADSPALAAGIQAGDVITHVNGQEVINPSTLTDAVKQSGGAPLSLTIMRFPAPTVGNATPVEPEVIQIAGLKPKHMQLNAGNGESQWALGVGLAPKYDIALLKPSPWAQFVDTLSLTWRTLRSLADRLNPIKVKHMSGPVGIVQAMTVSFKADFMVGLKLVVIISFSLAIVNLLPLPVLDGGHIAFGLIEGITRRRIPTRVAVALQYAFAVVIIGFFLFVTYADVMRLVPKRRAPAPPPAIERTVATDTPATTEAPAADASPDDASAPAPVPTPAD